MRTQLKDTSIGHELKVELATQCYYDWDPTDTEPAYVCLFTAIAKFLGTMKKTDAGKVALVINDYKGNMIMAAIVEYIPAEDPTMPGNWSYYFTFDPEDIKGINPTLMSNDVAFHKMLADVTLSLIHYRYVNTMFEDDLIKKLATLLKNCLDKNATAEEVFEIELPDIFVARVTVEDDQKQFAIEPSGKMSQLVKGDEEIEV